MIQFEDAATIALVGKAPQASVCLVGLPGSGADMVAQLLRAHGLCLRKVETVVRSTVNGLSGVPQGCSPVDVSEQLVKLLGELASPIKAVVCVRPRVAAKAVAFADSHGMEPSGASNEKVLRTLLPPWHVIVTHYESWFAAPYRELERIAEFVGLPMKEQVTMPAPWSLRVASADDDDQAVVLPLATVVRPWHNRKAA